MRRIYDKSLKSALEGIHDGTGPLSTGDIDGKIENPIFVPKSHPKCKFMMCVPWGMLLAKTNSKISHAEHM